MSLPAKRPGFAQQSDGARALARFDIRPAAVPEKAGPLAASELKRRERRAPLARVVCQCMARVSIIPLAPESPVLIRISIRIKNRTLPGV